MIPSVHLAENSAGARRSLSTGKAYPLGEADRPHRGTGVPAQRVRQQLAIVRYLNVEKSARYQQSGGRTYCNVYAYDYCYLNNVYLPRVWWSPRALADLSAGVAVRVKYATSVTELNANALYDWLRAFGPSFGWRQMATPDQLQRAVNRGSVGVICAQRVDRKRPGHIAAVVPEDVPTLLAKRTGGIVSLPLQSQAGARNFCFSCGAGQWWAGAQFGAFGFWTHV